MGKRIVLIILLVLFPACSWASGVMMGGDAVSVAGGGSISYVNKSTHTGIPDANIVILVPVGVQDGDMLFATRLHDVSTAVLTTHDDWALLQTSTGDDNFKASVYWRIANSEPVSYTFVSSVSSAFQIGTMAVFRKTSGTWNINASNETDSAANTSISANSITGVADSLLYSAWFNDGELDVVTKPEDMETIAEINNSTSVATAHYREAATAQSYSKSITWSGSEQMGVIQVVLEVQ